MGAAKGCCQNRQPKDDPPQWIPVSPG